jgi:hypothetical protein
MASLEREIELLKRIEHLKQVLRSDALALMAKTQNDDEVVATMKRTYGMVGADSDADGFLRQLVEHYVRSVCANKRLCDRLARLPRDVARSYNWDQITVKP